MMSYEATWGNVIAAHFLKQRSKIYLILVDAALTMATSLYPKQSDPLGTAGVPASYFSHSFVLFSSLISCLFISSSLQFLSEVSKVSPLQIHGFFGFSVDPTLDIHLLGPPLSPVAASPFPCSFLSSEGLSPEIFPLFSCSSHPSKIRLFKLASASRSSFHFTLLSLLAMSCLHLQNLNLRARFVSLEIFV